MIRTLLWKEYREQRMAIVSLAAFTIVIIVGDSIFLERRVSQVGWPMFVVCMSWIYGLMLGAQPFAIEIENKTMAWLDSLPAWRRQIGRTKVGFAFVTTIAASFVLIAYGVLTELIRDRDLGQLIATSLYFAIAGVGAGLLASSFASSAFGALGLAFLIELLVVLASAELLVLTDTLRPSSPAASRWSLQIAFVPLPLLFIYADWRFTRLDRTRRAICSQEAAR